MKRSHTFTDLKTLVSMILNAPENANTSETLNLGIRYGTDLPNFAGIGQVVSAAL